jgi:hypothetical protein
MVTELKINHIIRVRDDDSRIATARDANNKIHIYRISKLGIITKHNGLKSTWDPVEARIKESLRILIDAASKFGRSYKIDHI